MIERSSCRVRGPRRSSKDSEPKEKAPGSPLLSKDGTRVEYDSGAHVSAISDQFQRRTWGDRRSREIQRRGFQNLTHSLGKTQKRFGEKGKDGGPSRTGEPGYISSYGEKAAGILTSPKFVTKRIVFCGTDYGGVTTRMGALEISCSGEMKCSRGPRPSNRGSPHTVFEPHHSQFKVNQDRMSKASAHIKAVFNMSSMTGSESNGYTKFQAEHYRESFDPGALYALPRLSDLSILCTTPNYSDPNSREAREHYLRSCVPESCSHPAGIGEARKNSNRRSLAEQECEAPIVRYIY
ncbi:hypothetical protein B0H16DRAFT_1462008 [Mycena metata]|uniref:Uncharacterized protein n=1 Tax=Mycena metata TaxID=1033252 RepID=A0AAD7IP52_9AGAR|nr:hypothetical protein B0H16DRAFT_1462008 [Mycena metata]